MFTPRNALLLGLIFVVIGAIYILVQGHDRTIDLTGAVLLLMLGVAMSLGFGVMLRGSEEL